MGRAGLEQCKSRSERSMRGALGTFSVCTHHAWECSVNSQHVNDKEEQSFLPRERTIKPRSQRSSHVEKEGSCCYSEASVTAGNKLVTHQAAVPPPSLAHGGWWPLPGCWPLGTGWAAAALRWRCTELQTDSASLS